jgi:hypothetical protein
LLVLSWPPIIKSPARKQKGILGAIGAGHVDGQRGADFGEEIQRRRSPVTLLMSSISPDAGVLTTDGGRVMLGGGGS